MRQRCIDCCWLDLFSYFGLNKGEKICALQVGIIKQKRQYQYNCCSGYLKYKQGDKSCKK